MKEGVEEAKRKQLEAETKFKHMEGRVDNLKARIKELEDNNKVFTWLLLWTLHLSYQEITSLAKLRNFLVHVFHVKNGNTRVLRNYYVIPMSIN